MADEVRNDLKYTETHEWLKLDDNTAKVGITDHAQDSLTDIAVSYTHLRAHET